MVINYKLIGPLPPIVRALVYGHDAWIVGGAAKYMLGLVAEPPKDWDVLVPFHRYETAARLAPKGSLTNTFGGINIQSDGFEVDIWPGDVGHHLAQTPEENPVAVHLQTQTTLQATKSYKSRAV